MRTDSKVCSLVASDHHILIGSWDENLQFTLHSLSLIKPIVLVGFGTKTEEVDIPLELKN